MSNTGATQMTPPMKAIAAKPEFLSSPGSTWSKEGTDPPPQSCLLISIHAAACSSQPPPATYTANKCNKTLKSNRLSFSFRNWD